MNYSHNYYKLQYFFIKKNKTLNCTKTSLIVNILFHSEIHFQIK
jgi:hypothetical protein